MVFGFLILLPAGFLAFAFFRVSSGSSHDELKKRKASRAFKTFKKNLQEFDSKQETNELIRALTFACKNYFADKFHLKAEAVTISDVQDQLNQIQNIAKEEVNSLKTVFKWAEAMEYGGGARVESSSLKEKGLDHATDRED